MKIEMLRSQLGSRDGVLAEMFHAGREYDLTHTHGERDLAAVFVREGLAREVGAAVEDPSPEAVDTPAAKPARQRRARSDGA